MAGDQEYVRLSGKGRKRDAGAFFSISGIFCTLWLGKDHLLQVESLGGYSENYRRFYFRDIQALVVRKTYGWVVGNAVWGLMAGILGCIAAAADDKAVFWVFLSLAGCSALGLLLNILSGPTCVCHLKTAVHLEELPSLRRLRRARKVVARLKPLIEEAQGVLFRADAEAGIRTAMEQMGRMSAPPSFMPPDASSIRKPYESRAHGWLFGLLLAEAVLSTAHVFLPSVAVVAAGSLVGIMLAAAAVWALISQYQTDLKAPARWLAWCAGGYVALSYLTAFIVMIAMLPTESYGGTDWDRVKAFAAIVPLETPWLLAVLLAGASVSGVCGVLGFVFLNQYRREKPAGLAAVPLPIAAPPPVMSPPPVPPPMPADFGVSDLPPVLPQTPPAPDAPPLPPSLPGDSAST